MKNWWAFWSYKLLMQNKSTGKNVLIKSEKKYEHILKYL